MTWRGRPVPVAGSLGEAEGRGRRLVASALPRRRAPQSEPRCRARARRGRGRAGAVDGVRRHHALPRHRSLDLDSTPEAPRCRIVFAWPRPSTLRPLRDAARHRARSPASRGCGGRRRREGREPRRLRPSSEPGASYHYRAIDGAPLDARAVIAAQPPEAAAPSPLPKPEHRDAYVRGALRRAASAMRRRSGTRRYYVYREASRSRGRPRRERDRARVAACSFVAGFGWRTARARRGADHLGRHRARRGAA